MKKRISVIKELRSFLLLWGSQTVSALGTAMTNYALIIWAYEREGTASSLTTLTICSFLPTILFRFVGGTLADGWNKKRIMLVSDLAAACGTAAVFALYAGSALRVWHLYVINALLSLMDSLQAPAAFVATSLLVPKEEYSRVSGLQGFSRSIVSILAPALGSALLAFGGMTAVLACDLVSFAIAFFVLLFLIRIPERKPEKAKRREPFLRSCSEGIGWLWSHGALLRLTLFLTAVNFLAKLGNDGMLSPFVLARTGNDRQALGMVQSAVALGLLAGSLIMTVSKPGKKKTRVIFASTALVFVGNVVQSLSLRPWVWSAAAFGSYLLAAVMNVSLTTLMREQVPIVMQGRVFSAQDTLKNGAIPLGLFLGGALADHVFEPFMAADSPLQRLFIHFFGAESGAGIAAMFFCVGTLGAIMSLCQLKKPIYSGLDIDQTTR
ncbi:MAG: MFS transporter [Clostridia bacterium]|nr:MFS transporter [Clostridia bacterium]